jgi:lysophospholipase L1-like esterase
MKPRILTKLVLLTLPLSYFAFAQNRGAQEHWVTTWAASMLQTNIPNGAGRGPGPGRAGAPGGGPGGGPGGAPGRAPANARGGRAGFAPLRSFNNQTLRMIVRTSIGGRRIRVTLSNTFGANSLKIGAAHVALHDKDSAIKAGSDHVLTFSGNKTAVIPPGAVLVSDPVDLTVPALGDLAISVFLPEDTGPPTVHSTGLHTTYVSEDGDFTAQPSFMAMRTATSWYFLSSVDVVAPANTGVIVAYGDSITDGATSTTDANASWPSQLAKRLVDAGVTDLAVVDQGISGNRVLRENTGVNALARFDRDVLAQPGVKYLMILEGINDIGRGAGPNVQPGEAVTTDDLIAAYRQMIDRAHIHGIKVIGCTLTPYQGAAYYSDAGEEIRSAVNQWIRTSHAFDAVVDFDKATADPANSKQINPAYNIRDHLHPNDAGYKAMADAVDLSIFGVKRK